MPIPPGDVLDAVGGMHSPIVVSHVVPDADALGSMLATALALSANGCTPRISLPAGSVSQRLGFLVESAKTVVATPDDFSSADGFIVLDTAKKPRCNVGPELRQTDWSNGRPVVNIDHHATNTSFGDVNWIVGEAGSTCELVYTWMKATGVKVDAVTATLLLSGIHTDTLGFSLPSTSVWSIAAAAELMQLGADVGDLGERLYRSQTRSEFDLLRVFYTNTRVNSGGRLAYSFASYDEIHNAGCAAADIDDQINVPRSLEGAELAMLFTEGHKGKIRINFRGAGAVTVVDLAGQFGGGGHTQAAGAIVDGDLQTVIKTVVEQASKHLAQFETT